METIRLAPEDQEELSGLVSSYEPPGVYIKHVCFTNLSAYVSHFSKYFVGLFMCLIVDMDIQNLYTLTWLGIQWKELYRGTTTSELRGTTLKGKSPSQIYLYQILSGSKK